MFCVSRLSVGGLERPKNNVGADVEMDVPDVAPMGATGLGFATVSHMDAPDRRHMAV